MKLDYTIESPEERKKLVEQILAETPAEALSSTYLEIMADYLVFCMEKQERKNRKILTDNRLVTVNKRECSFEGLVSKFENGEDGIYNLISEGNHERLQPKISITEADLREVPGLQQVRDAIKFWEEELAKATGRNRYIIKSALIELRKEQYILKQEWRKPINLQKRSPQSPYFPSIDDFSYIDTETDEVVVEGVSLMDPKVIECILCDYSRLKQDTWEQLNGDTWYILQEFDEIAGEALAPYPIYERIVDLKVDKKQNNEIQQTLKDEFGTTYTVEYISNLWRNKIPKLIAAKAKERFLYWEYEQYGLPMKTCSRCGQTKPSNNFFFSKNKTSKDGFYSICKSCRNAK